MEILSRRRILSEGRALTMLAEIRKRFRRSVVDGYEHRARSCATCDTPGACCLDAHFVNVRISRLEAAAIRRELGELGDSRRARVYDRIDESIRRFRLDDGDSSRTYACPLYESGVGCLVHDTAKPLPCILHACYENKEDLPPEELLEAAELVVDRINRRVYGSQQALSPLPLAIRNLDAT